MSSTPLCSLPPGPQRRCVTLPGGCNLAAWGGPREPPKWLKFRSCFGNGFGLHFGSPRAPRRAQHGAREGPKTASERGFRRRSFSDPFSALFRTPQNPENRAPAEARCYFSLKLQIAPGGPKWSPKWPQNRAPNGHPRLPEGPKYSSESTSNFKWLSRAFFLIFEPPKGVPKGTQNCSKTGLGAQGLPKDRPGVAQKLPGSILGLFWAHFGAMLGPCWLYVGTTRANHFASKPPRLQTTMPSKRGPAAWGRSP